MKFNRLGRLDSARKALALATKLETNSKRARQILFGALRKELELSNALSNANTGIVYQLAKFIEEQDLNLCTLLDEWLLSSPQSKSLSPSQRPKLFYRYIRYERLSSEEQATKLIYLEVLKQFSSSKLAIPVREFKDLAFGERSATWFGKPVGDQFEDTLVDFLVVVFTEVGKFNQSLLHKPRTILQDFGWRVFDAWVIENYGSVVGYSLPTKAEFIGTTSRRKELLKLAKIRYQALERGDIEEYDRLGKEL